MTHASLSCGTSIRLTVVWRTRNPETIRRIREKFNLPPGMTINRETPAFISPEEMELLREVEAGS